MHIHNPTHRHHFVPECYLVKFTTNGSLFSLNVTDLKKGYKVYPRSLSPAQLCWDNNFYLIKPSVAPTVLTLQAPHELYIEKDVFQEFEPHYDAMYQKFIQQPLLPLDVANFMSKFIVHLKLRNPFYRKDLEIRKASILQQAINAGAEKGAATERGRQMSPISIELAKAKVFEEYNNNPETATDMFMSGLASRHRAPDGYKLFQDALLKGNWKLYNAPASGPKFLTTDNPGISKDNKGKFYNTRYQHGYLLTFPLSQDYCLTIDDDTVDYSINSASESKSVCHLHATEEMVHTLNYYQIQMINDKIIAADEDYLIKLAEINKPTTKNS